MVSVAPREAARPTKKDTRKRTNVYAVTCIVAVIVGNVDRRITRAEMVNELHWDNRHGLKSLTDRTRRTEGLGHLYVQ